MVVVFFVTLGVEPLHHRFKSSLPLRKPFTGKFQIIIVIFGVDTIKVGFNKNSFSRENCSPLYAYVQL